MKFSAAQLKSLRSFEPFVAALFYGEEKLFSQERAKFLLSGVMKESLSDVTFVEASALLSKEVFLKDLVGETLLWGDEKKILWVEGVTDRLLPLLKEALEDEGFKTPLILTTEKYLKPASKLRKHFEAEKKLLSMGCFPPTPQELRTHMEAKARSFGKSFDAQVASYLAQCFAQSPVTLDSELEKLFLYAGEGPTLSMDHVSAVMTLPEEGDYDDLIHGFLSKNLKEALRCLALYLKDTPSPIGVIRILLAQGRRLYTLKCLEDEGLSFDQCLMKVSPPIFSNQRDRFRAYKQRWHAKELERLLEGLWSLEAQSKRVGDISSLLLERFFIKTLRSSR